MVFRIPRICTNLYNYRPNSFFGDIHTYPPNSPCSESLTASSRDPGRGGRGVSYPIPWRILRFCRFWFRVPGFGTPIFSLSPTLLPSPPSILPAFHSPCLSILTPPLRPSLTLLPFYFPPFSSPGHISPILHRTYPSPDPQFRSGLGEIGDLGGMGVGVGVGGGESGVIRGVEIF